MARLKAEDWQDLPQGWLDVTSHVKPPSWGKRIYLREWRGIYILQTANPRETKAWWEATRGWQLLCEAQWHAWRYLPDVIKTPLLEKRGLGWLRKWDWWGALTTGSLISITTEEGQTLYPWRARWHVADALDLITPVPRSLLVRGETTWDGIAPPPAGLYLLVCTEANPMPHWEPASVLPTGPRDPALAVDPTPPEQEQGWVSYNQGNRTIAWHAEGVTITSPGYSAENVGGVAKPLPTPPYTITVGLLADHGHRVGAWRLQVGIRDADTDRLELLGLAGNTDDLGLRRYTNSTTYSSTVASLSLPYGANRRFLLRLQDDGTNIKWQVSLTGRVWHTLATTGRTAWVANPTQLVVALNPAYPAFVAATFWHYTETSP